MKHALYLIALCVIAADVAASELRLGSPDPFRSPAILPADEAFRVDRLQTDEAREVRFTMPPGYYLYRHAFGLTNAAGESQSFSVPPGEPKTDEFFGDVEVYYGEVIVEIPPGPGSDADLRYQGCADAGYCYPPKTIPIGSGVED